MVNLDNPHYFAVLDLIFRAAKTTAIMAEVSPELQERLEELDRELEVSRIPPVYSTNPRLRLNACPLLLAPQNALAAILKGVWCCRMRPKITL